MFVHRSSLLRLCEEYRGDHEGCEGAGEGEGEGVGGGEGEGEVKTVAWEEWGPDVTRWIDTGVVPWWITTSTGQRCVLSVSPLNGPDVEPSVIVLDFNPTSVKKLKSLKKTMDPYDSRYLQVRERQPFVFEEVSRISHPVFEKEVKSSLPNVTVAKLFNDQPFEFDGILMDEERLLGLVTDEDGRVTNIEIFHIGSEE
ncbi:hypothetical protein H0H93_014334 [Arthromyces matolae]|nr:hypothetical protein H0H93_014334 [Arthromyces matolae]